MTPQAPTAIRYDFPSGGLDPFDVAESRTQWVIEARGWARAWVPDDPAAAADPYVLRVAGESPFDGIPMGYRYLAVLEKLAVVVAGEPVREWPEAAPDTRARDVSVAFDRGARPGEPLDDAAIRRYLGNDRPWPWWALPYRVLPQTSREPWPDGTVAPGHHGYPQALSTARAVGSAEPVMVARVLAHASWH
ncbi:hypothetical protein [Marinactinospora rubrisoli]|uniref:Uncharacterized protein n=1 Tax=Marinactinospora rubrisoli TaxID=2715399 RepID=A0ABW2KCZ2_9ACTN